MKNLNTTIPAKFLHQVQKPARYNGGEFASIDKKKGKVNVNFALAFPDVYEVGMSYLGFKILYHILNKQENIWAERVYTPWTDMLAIMREHDITLGSLESKRPLCAFDIVGFTLQYELSYTNILTMLEVGKIPLLATERNDDYPLVVGGGPCVYNCEPLADFFDLFIIGEGEEVIVELCNAYENWKLQGKLGGKAALLKTLASIPGIYVPSLYQVSYTDDGNTSSVVPLDEVAPAVIYKRVVKDLEQVDFPTSPVVPFADIVHNRIMLEVFRGCTRGCRFCHAGIVYRPVRERSKETLKALARKLVDNTGYDEISLLSLSTADYSCLEPLIVELIEEMRAEKVSVSLPSLRIDSFSVELAQKVQEVRKSGLTFAPEAGTQRLRDVINKGVTKEDLLNAVGSAFASGWSSVKLYFMIGLPTETDEDIAGIADLAYSVLQKYREVKGKGTAKITVSVSNFVPKPHTPFQWVPQVPQEELYRRAQLLKSMLIQNRNISYQYHDTRVSRLEAVIAKGDRRVGRAILQAYRDGAVFDGWTEKFSYATWEAAFAKTGVDMEFYANRTIEREQLLPWDHIQPGVHKNFLWREYERALQATLTQDCRRGDCEGCGVCQKLQVEIVDHQGGSHE